MAAKPDEAVVDTQLSPKELKKKQKAEMKALKKAEKEATQNADPYGDADSEGDGFSFSILLIILFIILIWVAILGLLIKLDIGGFGSGVLYPILKDVPVINQILPDNVDENAAVNEFETLPDALAEIDRLNEKIKMLEEQAAKSVDDGESEEIKKLREEITRLRTFEDSQIEFDKLKTEFYEEVIFTDNAPEIEEYKKYYESIDPDNAEYLYKQVVQKIETDKELDEYVQAYTEMKPKQAAAIFEMMTDNLDLVAKILDRMEPNSRAKILGVMDSTVASQLTKIMDPD